ncbi:hypothetical protein DM02DRAFT_619198 [Periconia macrospinosa]|uniref:Uncharacterized protein n=1 Tax=Periconia macrospinosa TaxID=97972 RepID=A0A2V1D648_9PLEO|nr:hypothetical protein DM02DRAFT_619198 [Periconia macrospinosa]
MCQPELYDFDCGHRAIGETIPCPSKAQGGACSGMQPPRYYGARNGNCPQCSYPTPVSCAINNARTFLKRHK